MRSKLTTRNLRAARSRREWNPSGVFKMTGWEAMYPRLRWVSLAGGNWALGKSHRED